MTSITLSLWNTFFTGGHVGAAPPTGPECHPVAAQQVLDVEDGVVAAGLALVNELYPDLDLERVDASERWASGRASNT